MKKPLLIITYCYIVVLISSCGAGQGVHTNFVQSEMQSRAPQTATNHYGTKVELTAIEKFAMSAPGKRAIGMAQSYNEGRARQLAEINAKAAWVSALEMSITAGAKAYGYDFTQSGNSFGEVTTSVDGSGKQENLVIAAAKRMVSDVPVVKTEKYWNAEKKIWTVFVCVEYAGDANSIAKDAVNGIKTSLSDGEKAKIDALQQQLEKSIADELVKPQQTKEQEQQAE